MDGQPILSGAPALGHTGIPGEVYNVSNSVGDVYQTAVIPYTKK